MTDMERQVITAMFQGRIRAYEGAAEYVMNEAKKAFAADLNEIAPTLRALAHGLTAKANQANAELSTVTKEWDEEDRRNRPKEDQVIK